MLPTIRLQEETAIFFDAMEPRTLQWRLQIKDDYLVKFHRNPAGGLLLLEVKAEIRVFPDIYGSPRAALHLHAIFVIARALLVAERPNSDPLTASWLKRIRPVMAPARLLL